MGLAFRDRLSGVFDGVSRSSDAQPLCTTVLVYIVFLSLNVLVYDYYWTDVIILALAAATFEAHVWAGSMAPDSCNEGESLK